MPKRADYDRATVEAILDEALICHLAFVHDGQPFAIPTLHARVGDVVYVHGSRREPDGPHARARRARVPDRHATSTASSSPARRSTTR